MGFSSSRSGFPAHHYKSDGQSFIISLSWSILHHSFYISILLYLILSYKASYTSCTLRVINISSPMFRKVLREDLERRIKISKSRLNGISKS